MTKSLKLLLSCILLLSVSAPAAKAQDAFSGLGAAYLFGYGNAGFNGYSVGAYNRSLPYFSLHPPVYYGKRYARPYGVSPFATWPQLRAKKGYAPAQAASLVTPSLGCCGTVIENPYAPAESVPSKPVGMEPAVVHKATIEPLVIENPYYREAAAVQYTASIPE